MMFSLFNPGTKREADSNNSVASSLVNLVASLSCMTVAVEPKIILPAQAGIAAIPLVA